MDNKRYNNSQYNNNFTTLKRCFWHISIERVRNFLLISIFEGLLLSNNKKEKKRIIKGSKAPKGTDIKRPAAKVFIKLSENEKKFWQSLFQI